MHKILPVFLAAGLGTRLSHFQPKCLIKIKYKSLILRSILALRQLNFNEIVLVVGYEKSLIINELGNEIFGIKIHYIENQRFKITGTAFSFYCAKEIALRKNIDVMMIHGDILYDPNIYSQDINFNESSIFFDSSYSTNTNDEMVVFGKRGFVDSIIKGPNKELVKNHQGNVLGESLGINLFKADILEVLFDNLKKSVDINQQIHWEQTIVTLSVEKNIKLRGVDIAPLNWININYKDDLKIASKLSFV